MHFPDPLLLIKQAVNHALCGSLELCMSIVVEAYLILALFVPWQKERRLN